MERATDRLGIGVTGHRAFPDADRVTETVDRVLDTIDMTGPATVVSSLAEGADRLVARRALARPGWTLAVVLPLEPLDYLADFADERSRTEFTALLERADDVEQIPPAQSRTEGYRRAGHRVVDRSDALIALWDGEPAAGEGGTGEIVDHARLLDRPLAWVPVVNTVRVPPQGEGVRAEIIWERWPWPV